MAKQKLITKRKCRNTSYNDSSRYLCFHLLFVLISRSQNRTRELIGQDASGAEQGWNHLCMQPAVTALLVLPAPAALLLHRVLKSFKV